MRSRPLHIIWSASWRAQVAHLFVFAVMPATAAVLHLAFGILVIPFSLLSFGDRSLSYGYQVNHLQEPTCWVALAPCAIAERELVSLPWANRPLDRADSQAEQAIEPFISATLPTAITPRHLWFFLWFFWFLVFLWRWRKRGDA